MATLVVTVVCVLMVMALLRMVVMTTTTANGTMVMCYRSFPCDDDGDEGKFVELRLMTSALRIIYCSLLK